MKVWESPMAGLLREWKVGPGDSFRAGDELAVLESMKMEIPLVAEMDGKVEALLVEPGDFVDEGTHLLRYQEIP